MPRLQSVFVGWSLYVCVIAQTPHTLTHGGTGGGVFGEEKGPFTQIGLAVAPEGIFRINFTPGGSYGQNTAATNELLDLRYHFITRVELWSGPLFQMTIIVGMKCYLSDGTSAMYGNLGTAKDTGSDMVVTGFSGRAGNLLDGLVVHYHDAYCGDGYISSAIGEFCDDGNLNDNDGCSVTCQIESTHQCTNPANPIKPSVCSPIITPPAPTPAPPPTVPPAPPPPSLPPTTQPPAQPPSPPPPSPPPPTPPPTQSPSPPPPSPPPPAQPPAAPLAPPPTPPPPAQSPALPPPTLPPTPPTPATLPPDLPPPTLPPTQPPAPPPTLPPTLPPTPPSPSPPPPAPSPLPPPAPNWIPWTNGYSYAVSTIQTATPTDAKNQCASSGATLLFIRDIEEHDWLTTNLNFQGQVRYWVDIAQSQGGKWKWGANGQCARDDLWDVATTSTDSANDSCGVLTATGLTPIQCTPPSTLYALCKKPTTPPPTAPTAPSLSAPTSAAAPVGVKECKLVGVVNGFIRYRDTNSCNWPYIGNFNSTITIKCNPGYTLTDTNYTELTCGVTLPNSWSPIGTPVCDPTPASTVSYESPLRHMLPKGGQEAITAVGGVIGGFSGAAGVVPTLYQLEMLSSCWDGYGKSGRDRATSKLLLPIYFLKGFENVYTGSMFSLVIVSAAVVFIHIVTCVVLWKVTKSSLTVARQTTKLPSVETVVWDLLAAPISLCCWGMLISSDVSTMERAVAGFVLCGVFGVGVVFSVMNTHNVLTGNLVVSSFNTTPQGVTPPVDDLGTAPKLNPSWLFPSQYWHGGAHNDLFHNQHGYQITAYKPVRFSWCYTPVCTMIVSFTAVAAVIDHRVGCRNVMAVQMATALVRTVLLLLWRPYLCTAQHVIALAISVCESLTTILNFIPAPPPIVVTSFLLTVLCIVINLVYTAYSFMCRVKRINWLQRYDKKPALLELEDFTSSSMMTETRTDSQPASE